MSEEEEEEEEAGTLRGWKDGGVGWGREERIRYFRLHPSHSAGDLSRLVGREGGGACMCWERKGGGGGGGEGPFLAPRGGNENGRRGKGGRGNRKKQKVRRSGVVATVRPSSIQCDRWSCPACLIPVPPSLSSAADQRNRRRRNSVSSARGVDRGPPAAVWWRRSNQTSQARGKRGEGNSRRGSKGGRQGSKRKGGEEGAFWFYRHFLPPLLL